MPVLQEWLQPRSVVAWFRVCVATEVAHAWEGCRAWQGMPGSVCIGLVQACRTDSIWLQ